MSLKYRLIVLTVTVFAAAFGVGTLLGVRGARAVAEHQLRARLDRSAGALAGSGAPLNADVLARLSPLLEAELLVIEADARGAATGVSAHSGGELPWDELAARLTRRAGRAGASAAGGRRYFVGAGTRRDAATGAVKHVYALADERVVTAATGTILKHYLITLAATTVLLAGGTYLVGLAMVRRVNRLARAVDQTSAEDFVDRQRRGDEVARLSAAFDDLRERLDRGRERLARQQRLATAGKIASSVAHEVRNPLQAIRLTVQMLADRLPDDDREGIEVIVAEIDRLTLLTDELQVLAGKGTHRPEAVDLAAQLRETHRLLAHQLARRGLRMAIDLPELPAVRVDRNRCRQLLLNLLLNAAEASPGGGTIRIEGGDVGPAGVAIRISDEGAGFPEDVLAGRAQEFFSTKSTGAGLGLSICRRIVAEASGELKLYNTDRGAVAEVTLPVNTNSTN